MARVSVRGTTAGSVVLYLALAICMFTEQPGRTSTDTKLGLSLAPTRLISDAFALWDPAANFGEVGNQAYGYLFPMGPFFAVLNQLHVAPWVAERCWSLLVVALACEGARLVARELGLSTWPAWFAGVAYGVSPRMVTELGVRSAELLPVAALPWVLLPVVLTLRGRLGYRRAALFSAAAVPFAGAVNATSTSAPLALVLVFIGWGISTRRASWSLLAWWAGLVCLVSAWWMLALVRLGRSSPPFFDFVEDAATTTRTSGFDTALRSAGNWVSYLSTAGEPTWPAGWSLAYTPTLVLASGLIAAIAFLGLATFPNAWRTPLVIGALVALTCLTVGHSGTWASPLAPTVQDLLDHPFALLRNVTKIDPVLRLPMALGLGGAMAQIGTFRVPLRRQLSIAVVCGLLVLTVQPVLAGDLRTTGWTRIPDAWTEAAAYVAKQPDAGRTWVVPGAGFAVQDWGTTMDEPLSVLARTPWVTRSQAPVVPAATIRLLDRLEGLVTSGTGSPALGDILARVGIASVLVRHDLADGAAEEALAETVSRSLHASGGVEPTATFGGTAQAPTIEVFAVLPGPAPHVSLTPLSEVRTVAGDAGDLLAAVAEGSVGSGQAAIVRGDSGWTHPADVVGDGYADRERQFGRVHESLSALRTGAEPSHSGRRVPDYPGPPGTEPVLARYDGVRYADASTSQGFASAYGPIRPEQAPYAAIDGDPSTAWTAAFLADPIGQWFEVHFDEPQALGTVRIHGTPGVREWRIRAGSQNVMARADQFGTATAVLSDEPASTLRITVTVADPGTRASISEVTALGLPTRRTFVVPPIETAREVRYAFHASPEETTGIDRTFTLARGGTWTLTGSWLALEGCTKACATGSTLTMDGQLLPMHEAAPAALVAGRRVHLSAGTHRIVWTGTELVRPTMLGLVPFSPAPTAPSRPRTVEELEAGDEGRVRVGPGEAALLATAHNANPGWRASLDGVELVQQQVDGWAQGWIVPSGDGGTVTMSFAPQQPYRRGLVEGLVMTAALLALALRLLLATRLTAPAAGVDLDRGAELSSRRSRTVLVGAAWLLGGLPGILGSAAAIAGRSRPQARLVAGGALIGLGAVLSATLLALDGPRLSSGTADFLVGTGGVLLLVSALVGATRRWPRGAHTGQSGPMRTVVVNWRDLDHRNAGGAEKYAWEAAEALAAAGHRVEFLTARDRGQTRREVRDGIHVVRVGGAATFLPRALLRLARLRRALDLVIDADCGLPAFSPLVLSRRRTAIVLVVHHVHQTQFGALPGPFAALARWLERRAMPRTYRGATTVAVSESTRTEMRTQLGWTGPVEVIHNGTWVPTAVPAVTAEDQAAERVLILGRLSRHKRVDLALRAVAALHRPDVAIDVVGDGPELERLLSLAHELGITGRTRFHGRVSETEKHRLLARARVHLCASDAEGWGQVVLEAAGHGVPTLAREVPGLRDSVRPGRTGWLVAGDTDDPTTAAALASVLEAALEELSNPNARAVIAEECRAWCDRFSWSEMRRRIVAVADDALGRR